MKRLLPLILLCLIGMLNASVSQSLSEADSLSIGDSFKLEIRTDFALREVVVPDTLKDFRVLKAELQQRAEGSTASLQIAVLNTGALSFPKLELKHSVPDLGAQSTDAFRVHVLATRAESDTLLRALKAPKKYPWELPVWLYLLLGMICLGIAIYLLIIAMRKPAKAKPLPLPKAKPEAPPIPAWKKALAKLEDLRQSGLAERDILAYHYQLSAILREYLEEQYRFNAMEMTTSEIRVSLRKWPELSSSEALSILEYCDAVKFAKGQPNAEQITLQTQALQLYLMRQGGLGGL
jgi:hypothetical protein